MSNALELVKSSQVRFNVNSGICVGHTDDCNCVSPYSQCKRAINCAKSECKVIKHILTNCRCRLIISVLICEIGVLFQHEG